MPMGLAGSHSWTSELRLDLRYKNKSCFPTLACGVAQFMYYIPKKNNLLHKMILGNIHSREEWLDYGFAIQQVLDWLISGGKFA